MGGSCSSASATYAEGEDYKIPAGEQWRHAWCTVRVQHQLSVLSKKGKMWLSSHCRWGKQEHLLSLWCGQAEFLLWQKENHFWKWQWHSVECYHFCTCIHDSSLFVITACSCWPHQTKREKGLGIQSHSQLSIKFSHIHTGVPRRNELMN